MWKLRLRQAILRSTILRNEVSSREFCQMFTRVIFLATVLPMLVHSILGCCWHHAHAHGKLNCVHSTHETHSGHDHYRDHRSEHNDPVAPAPCDHDESCNDMRCVYLVAEPGHYASALELHEQVVTLDCCSNLILNAMVPAPARTQQGKKVPLPSEHCALTQVWVV